VHTVHIKIIELKSNKGVRERERKRVGIEIERRAKEKKTRFLETWIYIHISNI